MKKGWKCLRKRLFAVLLAVMISVCEFGVSGITGLANADVSGNDVSAETVSDNDVSDGDFSISDNSAEEVTTDINTEKSTGNDVSGNDVSDNDVSGNDISGNDISGNDISGNDVSGNDVSGNDVSDNDVSGNDISGNDVSGNDISANDIGAGNEAYSLTAASGEEASTRVSTSVVVDKEEEGSLAQRPSRPQLGYGTENNQKIVINATTVSLSMTAESGCKIYYSLNGKTPTFKKGVPSANAQLYSSSAKIGNQSKVVVKAIAVNAAGLCSPVTTHTFLFKPAVSKVTLSALGSTSSTNTETGVTTISVNLVKGKSLQINAAYVPVFAINKELTWEIISAPSNAGSEVKVSYKGKVTTTKKAVAGTYKVRATLKNNASVRATINVNVVDAATIQSLKVDKKTISLTTKGTTSTSYNLFQHLVIDASKTLTAKSFVWSSSNPDVATVNSSGVVATVAGNKGKTVVTAIAKDGSGKKVNFTVKVTQQATKVTISGESKLGLGKSNTLTATVTPADAASQKVKWEIIKWPTGADKTQVKINSKGKISATKNADVGEYTIKATALDGSEKSGTFSVTVQAAMKSVTINSDNLTLYRVTGGTSIAAKVSSAVLVSALTTEGKASTNLEILNTATGIVTATYDSSTKKITIKATGKGTGKATITCQAKDGSKVKDSIEVTVANPPSSIDIQLPKGSTGDLAMNYTHKPKVVVGTKYGDPGKVKVTWSLAAENENIQLNTSTGALKIRNTASAGATFKLIAAVQGELKLKASVSCTARTRIKKLEVYFNGSKIVGEPISDYGEENDLQIVVQEEGSTKMGFVNGSSVTQSITLTASSNDLGLTYNSKAKTAKIKSKVPGKYKITVKALDGTGISKTYKIRVGYPN